MRFLQYLFDFFILFIYTYLLTPGGEASIVITLPVCLSM